MKAATKLVMRHQARTHETEGLSSLKADASTAIIQDRYLGQMLPLSMAPYRLRAADRWWHENGSSEEAPRKRPS